MSSRRLYFGDKDQRQQQQVQCRVACVRINGILALPQRIRMRAFLWLRYIKTCLFRKKRPTQNGISPSSTAGVDQFTNNLCLFALSYDEWSRARAQEGGSSGREMPQQISSGGATAIKSYRRV